MRHLAPDQLTLAVLVAALAGMVDVVAFLALGGFFASFMSGNSTRLAVGATQNWLDLQLAASLIGAFVGGVLVCALLRRRHAQQRDALTLCLVAGLITLSALLAGLPIDWPIVLLASAMGAVNLLFERDGDVRVGLTYMSGTLVRLGQALADRLAGDRSGDWQRPLLLWSGFIGGGLIGVGLFARFGLPTLWVPAALAAALAVFLWERPVQPVAPAVSEEPDH